MRWWVAVLLRLYPASFRDAWGDELRATLDEQVEAGRSRGAVLWMRTTWGMLRGASAEWRREFDEGDGMGGWMRDIRQAVRRLARKPAFALVAVGTLGVGAGAFGAVWATVESVLLEPLAYERPEELAWAWRDYSWLDVKRGWMGSADALDLAGNEAVAATAVARSGQFNMALDGGRPREVRATLVSSGFFETLGVAPALGRGFLPDEDMPGAPGVVVLGHPLWTEAFGADPGIVGQTIELDRERFEVVGIAPEGFDFVKHSSLGDPDPADLWTPLRVDVAEVNPGNGWLAVLLRWRTGSSEAERQAALARASEALHARISLSEGRRIGVWAAPLTEDLVGDVRSPLFAVLAAAGLLLLILAANLATLFAVQFAERDRDAAVRSALGAGRGGLVRWVAAEMLAIGLAGAVVALLLARWGARILSRFAAEALPRSGEIGLDASGAALVVGLVGLLVTVAAVVPVVRTVRMRPAPTLRGGSRGGDAPSVVRGRAVLVGAQVALSLVLLVGAGLLTRSLAGLLRTDPGFDPAGTLTFRVSLDGTAYADGAAIGDFQVRLLEELRALPGVDAAGLTSALPLGLETNQSGVGLLTTEEEDAPLSDFFTISDGYLEAAGLRLQAGRDFRRDEGGPGDRVAIIDDLLARRVAGSADGRAAVGRRVVVYGDTATVVGVVDQARFYEVHRDDRSQVYVPVRWNPRRSMAVALRTAGRPDALPSAARRVVQSLDPAVPVSDVASLDRVVQGSLETERTNLWIVGTFALAGLLLVSLAVFGVAAGAVARRRAEIGIRMAMGADPGRVRRMVVREGMRPIAAGTVAGLVGAFLLAGSLADLLEGVDPRDPLTYTAVAAILAGVAFLATALPARRAAALPPTEALRDR